MGYVLLVLWVILGIFWIITSEKARNWVISKIPAFSWMKEDKTDYHKGVMAVRKAERQRKDLDSFNCIKIKVKGVNPDPLGNDCFAEVSRDTKKLMEQAGQSEEVANIIKEDVRKIIDREETEAKKAAKEELEMILEPKEV